MKSLIAIFFAMFLYGYVAEISAIVGKADIKRNNLVFSAKVGEKIEVKDEITTYQNTKLQLIFKDDTVITIGKNSKFKVEEFIEGNNPEAKFNLAKGIIKTLTGEIGKIAPRHFNVETPNALIGVRGTEFYVKTDVDFTEVGVMYGKVELIGLINRVSKLVNAGEMAVYYPQMQKIEKKKLDIKTFNIDSTSNSSSSSVTPDTTTTQSAQTSENNVKESTPTPLYQQNEENTETNEEVNNETTEETNNETTTETEVDEIYKFTPVTSSMCFDGLVHHNVRVDAVFVNVGLLGWHDMDSVPICGVSNGSGEVEIYVNGEKRVTSNVDGNWELNVPLDTGKNAIRVIVRDDSGSKEYDGEIYNLSDSDYQNYLSAISNNDPSVISSIFGKDYTTEYSDGIVSAGWVLDDEGNKEVPWIVGYMTDSNYVDEYIVKGAETRYEGVIKALSENGELDGRIFIEFRGEDAEGENEGFTAYFDFESINFSGEMEGDFDRYHFEGSGSGGYIYGNFYGDEADRVGGRVLFNHNGEDINGVFIGDKE